MKSNFYHNISLCFCGKQEYKEALYHSSSTLISLINIVALEINPTYLKAMYRQCEILFLLQDYKSALQLVKEHIQSTSEVKDKKLLHSLEKKILQKMDERKEEQKKAEDLEILEKILEVDRIEELNITEEDLGRIALGMRNNLKFYESVTEKTVKIIRIIGERDNTGSEIEQRIIKIIFQIYLEA